MLKLSLRGVRSVTPECDCFKYLHELQEQPGSKCANWCVIDGWNLGGVNKIVSAPKGIILLLQLSVVIEFVLSESCRCKIAPPAGLAVTGSGKCFWCQLCIALQ